MKRSTVVGWAALCFALAVASGAAADFGDGVRAYNSGDYAAAHAAWLPLAEAGEPAAARNLGHLYRTGRGVARDLAQALRWYRRAADQGFAGAQANLGDMFARGQGVATDYAAAAVWFHRAAVQGHVAAQYNLGLLYETGLGVEVSEETAMAWYHRAAGAGHQGALEQLSRLVAGGASPASAEELALEPPEGALEPAHAEPAAVPAPDPETLSVAERLRIGRTAFRARDYASALEAWRPLAEAGNAIAQFHMGGLYADGTGVAADAVEARKWWALAAAQSHDRAAQLLAASAPEAPEAPEADEAEMGADEAEMGADEAEMGADEAEMGAAETEVAVAAQPDRERAPAPAPDEESAPAATVEAVPDRATLATLSGPERLRAGVAAYRTGEYALAAAAWLPLAEAGNAWAQFYLGGLYHDGDGVATNLARAHMWWTLAAGKGHLVARELLAELEPRMDANTRAEAEAMVAVWRRRE